MRKQMMVLGVAAATLAVMAGCKDGTTTSAGTPAGSKTLAAGAARTFDPSGPAAQALGTPQPTTTATTKPATTPKPTPSKTTTSTSGATIVSFTLVQKPKCAEGTAVFRAANVPAVIKWKITGATGAALSVDDNTHTAGTYGPEPLSGTETFDFGCKGPVGSTEKHTYAIYTVGGGQQHSITITATAKVLDNGKN